MSSLLKTEPFFNVAPGQRAILNSKAVLGTTVKKIFLILGGGLVLANLTNIKIFLNQKQVWEITGPHLDAIQDYLGVAADAGFLTIPFDDITAALPGETGEDAGSLDTTANGVRSFEIQVDIAAGANAASTLAASFDALAPLPRSGDAAVLTPAFRHLIRSTLTPNSANEHSFSPNVGQNAKALLGRMYIFHANLTQLEVKKNGVPIFEEVSVALNEFVQKEHGRVPQAGLYVFDPLANGDNRNLITTAGAFFEWLFTVSAADTLTVYADVRTTLQLI